VDTKPRFLQEIGKKCCYFFVNFLLAPICKSNVCPLFPPLKTTTTTPHHFSSSGPLERWKIHDMRVIQIQAPSDRDLKASDVKSYFLKCMCSPKRWFTLRTTQPPHTYPAALNKEQVHLKEIPLLKKKMKILTTLQQKKPKLLLCTEDSKLYVLYISPPPQKSIYHI